MPFERPGAAECPEYYFTYINQVPDGDVRAYLAAQLAEADTLFVRSLASPPRRSARSRTCDIVSS